MRTSRRCTKHLETIPIRFPPSPRISMLLRILLSNLRNYFRGSAPRRCRQKQHINIEIRGCGGELLRKRNADPKCRTGCYLVMILSQLAKLLPSPVPRDRIIPLIHATRSCASSSYCVCSFSGPRCFSPSPSSSELLPGVCASSGTCHASSATSWLCSPWTPGRLVHPTF